ncbi:Subtilisin-related protease/Vacuolar protease B [Trachipleistophora hominis]|uniref:Subtilisin-related protease/Vacuolar protease B n=1 Tax=Trachipleistophora hominis TaxID=72359 RepID=L7JTA6_TRAHO|nr:Subtilisin-related protease/Vacuolar protease B [Trachipleistophora hominis]
MFILLIRYLYATRYIVMLKDNPKRYNYNILSNSVFSALGIGDSVINTLSNGFIGDLEEESAQRLRNNENVAYVEKDKEVSIKDFTVEGGFVLSAGNIGYESKSDELDDKNANRGDKGNRNSEEDESGWDSNTRSKLRYVRGKGANTNRSPVTTNRRLGQTRSAPKDKNRKNSDIQKSSLLRRTGENNKDTSRTRIQSYAHAALEHQDDAPWGISRISSGTKVNSLHTFRYPHSAGKGAQVYVIDTGVETSHPELQGRAFFGANFTTSGSNTDQNGHGTHVAGVIAGKTVGIARKAEIIAVKVLDKMGSGMLSSVIMGIDYVIRKHSEKMERYEEDKRKEYYKRVLDGRYDSGHELSDGLLSDWRGSSTLYRQVKGPLRSTSAFDPMWRISNIVGVVRSFLNAVDKDMLARNGPSDQLQLAGISNPLGTIGSDWLFSTAQSSNYTNNPLNIVSSSQKPKSIVNMSVGGLKSKVLDYAVKYATDIGIHFSAAAGNDHEDACEFSPSSSKLAMTAGASTASDTIAFFSNYGQCVDLYAPGVDIKSSWIKGEYRVVSGTSMAAPHVTGAMALYLGEKEYTPAELIDMLKNDSYKVVHEPGKDTNGNYPLVSIRKLIREIYDKRKRANK